MFTSCPQRARLRVERFTRVGDGEGRRWPASYGASRRRLEKGRRVARSKFGQYFRAGADELAPEPDAPDTQAADYLGEHGSTSQVGIALNGQRIATGQLNGANQIRSRAGLTRPQKCALVLMAVLTGVAALLGVRTWSGLIPIALSALLSGVVWTTSVSLLRALRRAD